VGLKTASEMKILSDACLKKNQVGALIQFSKLKTKERKWELMKMKTMRPIWCHFEVFYEVDKDAAVAYFTQIMDNWISTTLLFEL